MEPFPHIRVEGSPRERGRSYGEQAADRVRRSIEAYHRIFRHYTSWDWETVSAEASRFREPIDRFGTKYLEEIAGIAEGADVASEDVLAINVRTELMFAAKARAAEADGRRVGECTAFAVLPEASTNGHTLIGQNWDWLLHSFDTVVVLESRQDDGPSFVTVVEAGLLGKTGMNSSGIGLVTNALVTDLDRGEPGIPYHVVLRGILDAENISDALSVAQRGFRSSSANYLVATRDRLAVDIEAAPGDFSHLSLLFPEGGVMLHTNHFLSPALPAKDVSLWVMPDSPFRFERLRSEVNRVGGKLTIDHFRAFLRDHANYPSSICFHPDTRMDPYDRGATVTSVLMDLHAKRMWLAEGYPCSNMYRELDYSGFLSKPSPVDMGCPALTTGLMA